MSLPLFTLQDAMVTFGGAPLLDGIGFSIHPRDRICLLGRNGSGKSTLMKVIAGTLELDRGERFVQPGVSIGYLPQDVRFEAGDDVYAYVLRGLPEAERGGDSHYRADIVLAPLELSGEQKMAALSGGQQRRAALARALIAQPALLLLDEPTNHLDIASILWLEEYLAGYPGALLCVSHDRAFLHRITGKTFWLDRGRIRVHGKGYEDFERWSEEIAQQEEAHLQKLGKKLEEEQHWLARGVTARRTRNMRRLHDLFRLREKLKSERSAFARATGSLALPDLTPEQSSTIAVEMESVHKAFGEKCVLKPFSTRIVRGDRIGIIGRNGSGKSTFLKLLTGALEPDGGRLRRSETLSPSYFDQNRAGLALEKTLWQNLCDSGGDQVLVGGRSRHVAAYLGDFLFESRQFHSPASSLSGGEANRLLLAKVLANPGNLLILDEPTNDLDMDTLDMLQETLADYEGTLIVVSHDRDFLDRIATRIFAFEGDGAVEEYIGGYGDYVAQRRLSAASFPAAASRRVPPSALQDGKTEKAHDAPKPKSAKLSYKHQRALDTLPAQMDRLQGAITSLEAALMDADLFARDAKKFQELTSELERKREELTAAEELWLEAEMERERLE